MTKEMIQIQNSLEEFRADQLGAMLITCRRIIQTDKDECAVKIAEILRIQVLFELARRTHLENGAEVTASAPAEPWLFAIEDKQGKWKDGEQCVFGDYVSAQNEVDMLNDAFEEGDEEYKVVPLYRVIQGRYVRDSDGAPISIDPTTWANQR